MLRVVDLTVRFGGVLALDSVGFDVAAGEVCGVIGPSGAGKTTLCNCISRLCAFERGAIEVGGVSIGELECQRMAGVGIARPFEHLALFQQLSVLENIMVGAHARRCGGLVANALRLSIVRREEARVRARAMEIARTLDLDAVLDRSVGELPLATQKRVGLARALSGEPKLLLLDEPTAGLGYQEVAPFMTQIRRVREDLRVAVLLAEHRMHVVMNICDRVVVLDSGRKIAEGAPYDMQQYSDVIRADLGAPPNGERGHSAADGARLSLPERQARLG